MSPAEIGEEMDELDSHELTEQQQQQRSRTLKLRKIKREPREDAEREGAEEREESGRRSKRPRIDPDDEQEEENEDTETGDDDDEEEEEEEEETYFNQISEERLNLLQQRGADGYLPGSIVRVACEKFLTYDHTEFSPGPYLNMIIGPNGTGKSSVVCAIALGLGFSQKVLGRSGDITQFIKHGASTGWVEIEVKSPKGEKNLIVKRTLVKTKGEGTFTINGKRATRNDVKEKMSSLNIQVNNLCSFLPQDRVAEFAAMSPQLLLIETLKAIGDENMITWRAELVQHGAKIQAIETELEKDRDECEKKEGMNQTLRRGVEAFQERERLSREIAILEIWVPFAQYAAEKSEWDALRKTRRKIGRELNRLKEAVKPYNELHTAMKKKIDKIEQKRRAIVDESAKFQMERVSIAAKLESLEGKADTARDAIEAVKADYLAKEKKKIDREIVLEKAQVKLAAMPEPVVDAQLDEDLKKNSSEIRNIVQMTSENLSKAKSTDGQIKNFVVQIRGKEADIAKLRDAESRRLENLRNWPGSRDHYEAVSWIKSNRNLFDYEVHLPPCLSVDVLRPEFADAVESFMNVTTMRTFICQSEKDYQTLNRHLCDSANNTLGRQLRIPTAFVEPGDDFVPTYPTISGERIRQLGFSGFAIDLVRAPAPVLRYLEENCSFSRAAVSPYGAGDRAPNADQAIQEGLNFFVAGRLSQSITTSRYGARSKSSAAIEIQKAKSFALGVDTTRVAAFEADLELLVQQRDSFLPKLEEYKERERKLHSQHEALRLKKDGLTKKKEEQKNISSAYQKAQVDLNSARKGLAQAIEALKVTEADAKRKHQEELKKYIMARLKLDSVLRDSSIRSTMLYQEGLYYGLELLQLTANLNSIEKRKLADEQSYAEKQEEWSAADKRFQKLKAKTENFKNQALSLLSEAGAEIKQAFQDARDAREAAGEVPTVAQLEEQHFNLRDQYNAAHGGNAADVGRYERTRLEVETLKQKIRRAQDELNELKDYVEMIQQQFEPALLKLISKVSDKFAMSLAALDDNGYVELHKEKDFEKWAIDIKVSFRKSDAPVSLDANRQSGGERSLTTIMYFMSLIEISSTPFSLVDEINQGMDPRAEREVHNQMVKVTCQENSAQFFLLTPKLLTDLHYDEKARVLVVCNGDWIPGREPGTTKKQAYLKYRLDLYKQNLARDIR